MCIYIVITATILAVTLWHMKNAELCLKMQWLWIGIFAGRALKQRQCTRGGGGGGAWYVNVWGSVHWEGV